MWIQVRDPEHVAGVQEYINLDLWQGVILTNVDVSRNEWVVRVYNEKEYKLIRRGTLADMEAFVKILFGQ